MICSRAFDEDRPEQICWQVLKEGYCTKTSRGLIKSSQKVYFVLDPVCLYVCKDPTTAPEAVHPVHLCQVECKTGNNTDYSFDVVSPEGAFHVQAASEPPSRPVPRPSYASTHVGRRFDQTVRHSPINHWIRAASILSWTRLTLSSRPPCRVPGTALINTMRAPSRHGIDA